MTMPRRQKAYCFSGAMYEPERMTKRDESGKVQIVKDDRPLPPVESTKLTAMLKAGVNLEQVNPLISLRAEKAPEEPQIKE